MARDKMQCPIDGCSFTGKQIGQHLRRKQDAKHRQFRNNDEDGGGGSIHNNDTKENNEDADDEDLQDPGEMFNDEGQKYVTGSEKPQKPRDNKPQTETFACPSCGEDWSKGDKQHKCGESFNCPRCEKPLRPFAQNKCRCGYKLPKKWGSIVA